MIAVLLGLAMVGLDVLFVVAYIAFADWRDARKGGQS